MTGDLSRGLSVQLAPNNERGLLLSSPVIVASGTFGYGMELADNVDIQRLGAIVCKGITPHPRKGNPYPRIVETASGMLNSIGLQNVGIDALIKEKAPIWASWQVPVIVNISGETVEEYVGIANALEGVSGISAIEVNISCPNIKSGGIEFGTHPRMAAEVTSAARKATTLPLLVKLAPNVTDIVEIARVVVEAGADALSLVNTFVGMAIDINKRRPALGTTIGGLSGPAIKPLALALVYQVAQATSVPIVGIGGITTAYDALEFIMAGAHAVEIGTANFRNPGAALDILDGIISFMERENVQDLSQLVGTARV